MKFKNKLPESIESKFSKLAREKIIIEEKFIHLV